LNQAVRTNVKKYLTVQVETLKAENDRLKKTEQERIARSNLAPVSAYTKKMYIILFILKV